MFKAADFLMNNQPGTALKKETLLYNIGQERAEQDQGKCLLKKAIRRLRKTYVRRITS